MRNPPHGPHGQRVNRYIRFKWRLLSDFTERLSQDAAVFWSLSISRARVAEHVYTRLPLVGDLYVKAEDELQSIIRDIQTQYFRQEPSHGINRW